MNQIRFKSGNVFLRQYDSVQSSSNRISVWVSSRSLTRDADSISQNSGMYGYWNKYLKDDPVYDSFSSRSGDRMLRLYNRDPDSVIITSAFKKPDYIQKITSISAGIGSLSLSAQRSSTGIGYQYFSTSADNFAGWYFPFQKSFIIDQQSAIGQVISDPSKRYYVFQQDNIYYMTQQSYYIRSLGNQHNKSNNCVTAVTYENGIVDQFIKDKNVYVTTIALLDDNNNKLAIGKFSRPIKKLGFLPTSFKLRFFN